MIKKLKAAKLVVVDFNIKRTGMSEDMKKWQSSNINNKIVCVEKCDRRIFMGDAKSFSEMPDISEYDDPHRYEGADAYAQMLLYMTGLANPTGLDKPANERFYVGWGRISNKNSEQAVFYSGILEQLTRDSQFITSHIVDRIRPSRPWLIAREISQLQKDSHVVVIGELSPDGQSLSTTTLKALTTANGETGKLPETLTYIFPDDPDGTISEAAIKKLRQQEKLRIPNVQRASIDDLSKIIETADAVYVAGVAGKDPEQDLFIADCWRNRLNDFNYLIHSNTEVLGDESAFEGLGNHIPASTIHRIEKDREQDFEVAKTVAQDVAETFAKNRCLGRSPCRVTVRQRVTTELNLAIS